jgi:iron complex outermembrane receptor protein
MRTSAWILSLVVLIAGPVLAEEKNEEGLDEELSELEDADYPDLVAADEESGIIDEFAMLADDAMVELAARHKQDIGMSPSAVTVFTRKDIEASGAITVTDLLRLVPGMDVVLVSPAFSTITSRLYWTNENWQYLVLVDGRDATLELIGVPYWEIQPVMLEDIERIEVIRGPGSALYGANAMAGVVSITTRSVAEETSAWARVGGGETGRLRVGARASTRVGDWAFSLSGGGEKRGSFLGPQAEGMQVYMLRSVVEYRLAESSRFRLDMALTQGEGPLATGIGDARGTLGIRTMQLSYLSEDLRGKLYWIQSPITAEFKAPLEYRGIRLAEFAKGVVDAHTVDGEVQWTLPRFWEPLMVIVGGGGRFSWLSSDSLLDADTYGDITSADYHQPGIEHHEFRAGAFIHGELAPADWFTCTFGTRFDYNNITDVFISPRLAGVFRPVEDQFIRLGVARSFRKPAFMETHLHPMAVFPPDSPITGGDELNFQEFLTRVIGNSDLGDEELLAFEIGYLGRFLDGELSVALDLYYNYHSNVVEYFEEIVPDENGLPDLNLSSVVFKNEGGGQDIIGSELVIHYEPVPAVNLLASWVHREVLGKKNIFSPKNLITVGGRFNTDSGLVGSLYVFSRSEFTDPVVANPAGVLEPKFTQHMDHVFLAMGKLGYRWKVPAGVDLQMEAGAKLFLPISPFGDHLFRYREVGGVWTKTGENYGGEELRRIVTGYLQGSF